MNNNLLKSFLRCKRKAWLDFKGDKSRSVWCPHKSIELINENKNFHQYTNDKIYFGLNACKEGRKAVAGLSLKIHNKYVYNSEIQPPLLIKVAGQSKWGEYKYIPAVSKLGRKTTNEHRLELAFCVIHLEKFQVCKIHHGLVISNFRNNFQSERIFINDKLREKASKVFDDLLNSLNKEIPEITKDRKKCSICSWQKYCNEEAKSNGILTDIDGIGFKTELQLKEVGINNIQQLALSSEDNLKQKLSAYKDTRPEKINKFIKQSRSYLSGVPFKLSSSKKTLLDIDEKLKSGFFIIDIESNPDESHDFLYGFLSVENINGKLKETVYEPLLDLNHNNNNKKLHKIIQKIQSKKQWLIVHYGETEKVSIIKIAKKLKLTYSEIEELKSRLIDLHLLIRSTWVLPLKNYSLKTVAKWIGFEWKEKNISGSQALLWWIQYLNTSNESFLTKIIKYNKDDCLATLSIINWLKN